MKIHWLFLVHFCFTVNFNFGKLVKLWQLIEIFWKKPSPIEIFSSVRWWLIRHRYWNCLRTLFIIPTQLIALINELSFTKFVLKYKPGVGSTPIKPYHLGASTNSRGQFTNPRKSQFDSEHILPIVCTAIFWLSCLVWHHR